MLVEIKHAVRLAAAGERVDGRECVEAAVPKRGSACMKAAWHHQVVFPLSATLEDDDNSGASTTFIYRYRKENTHTPVC